MKNRSHKWIAVRAIAIWRRIAGRRVPSRSSLSWCWAEECVRHQMERSLSGILDLAEQCDELAFAALKSIPPGDTDSPLQRAHSALMSRAVIDLRVSCQLALSGYTMQSWSVAASCFEASHSIGFIGADATRADRWINHSDRASGPWSVKDAVQNALIHLELEPDSKKRQELVDHEYKLYEWLCIAKHVNPVSERSRYFHERNGPSEPRIQPFVTDSRVREAKLGLLVAIRSATTGIWSLLKAQPSDRDDLLQRVLPLMSKAYALLPDSISCEGGARVPISAAPCESDRGTTQRLADHSLELNRCRII